MKIPPALLWLLAAAPAFAAPLISPRGEFLVVDVEGSAPFTSLQEAVDAASSGDVILLRPQLDPASSQPGCTIDGKALTI
ncbi:hypothetical protein Poly30_40070 [Planctomycetes bacterium Poly30]|uniref:Uncharacterized protein n=1 Tax=Saltatorellus ferox TaxID=2528018 RepID=A0A518EWL1_9BACT|nr:hypothetical protein Poly30_40070 [Planctomycetes bacterium Poly30]